MSELTAIESGEIAEQMPNAESDPTTGMDGKTRTHPEPQKTANRKESSMTTKARTVAHTPGPEDSTIRDQVQNGIDARIDQKIIDAARPLALAFRTMLGLDGTSIDDAVEQAYTPTGPSRDVIRARIKFRRAHPDQLYPDTDQRGAA